MGFSLNEYLVRGDLFTETGKWKYTVTLNYEFDGFDYEHWDIHTMARRAFANGKGVSFKEITSENGYRLVVLEPYALNGYPIMIQGDER